MACLDANAVQDLMGGALDDTARTSAIAHLDECADCRDVVSAVARDPARVALAETAASAPPPPRPGEYRTGQTLGRYAIAERLGAGAMGVVYRAEDPELGRSVALKLLHVPDRALTERLVREARSMAKVNHPNVVAVYDVGHADDATYIAMELVDGGSLRAWQAQPRSVAEIVAVYLAAGRGLAAAHAAGLVHRDFKPDNVLVGRDGRVRVTDFGLAAVGEIRDAPAPDERAADVALTRSGTILGTPAYMAPEQFDAGHVDARTDQFAFCVALFEALYGTRPFDGASYQELAERVCAGTLRPVPAREGVSSSLRAIVLRGLASRPGDRHASMDHLLDQLARDRAKPWRRLAVASTVLAGVLGLGIGADLVVRDRVAAEIDQAFTATGVQVSRAFRLLVEQFDANANQMYHQSAMVKLAAHRDEADFGLGDPAVDATNRQDIHAELVSTDWSLWRRGIGHESLVLAVGDGKGRLFYTSAAPEHWRTRVTSLPWLRRAIDAGDTRTIVLQRTTDPALVATGLLGPAPPPGLGFFFARLHIVNGEITSFIVQALDAAQLIPEIQLDDETQLSILSPDGLAVGQVAEALGRAAPHDASTAEVRHGGATYLVKSQPLTARDGARVGHVVMARRLGGVISGFFPGARTVFAGALLAMLGLAAFAFRTARRSRAR